MRQTAPIVHASGHVRREGLLERLRACHARTALTWVVGLPGSGKTSAVQCWLEETATPALWYRVRRGDSDGAELFDAVHRAFAAEGRSLPRWSPENQLDPNDFARRLFAELSGTNLTLVLDDCHHVEDEAPLFAMFASYCSDPRAGGAAGASRGSLRAFFIGRRGPPPSLARGAMAGWLSVVDDLRLTQDEVRQIAAAHDGLRSAHHSAHTPSDETRDETRLALASADGWLAHVLALCRSPSLAGARSETTGETVGDFLAMELLAAVSPQVRPGLRRLAELPEIPRSESGSDSLAPEARGLLATLAAQGYFVNATPERFRLHDLLRDALLRRNTAEDSPEALRDARRRLAAWVEGPMPDAAMQLYSIAGDTRGALLLLERHGASWFERGLHRAVGDWVSHLPEPEDPDARAALAFYRAQALLPLEPERARPLFAAARLAAVESVSSDRAYLSWCGEVASYVIQWGAVHGLADQVDILESLRAKLGAPDGDIGFRTNADALTALMYGRADDPRIARFADATARAVAHASDAGARIAAAAQLLIYKMWWSGDFPGGRALYQTFDSVVDEGAQLPPLPRLLWWSCASIVDWQCGDPGECYRKVERGLALAEASGVHVRDFFLLTQGIFCALSQEDWARAERYLARLARTERGHKRLDVMVHLFFRSWYSLCRGDPRTALAHADAAWSVAESIGSMFHKVIVLSALAPARVHTGDIEGAEEAYRAQLALAKAANNPTFTFIAFCAGAEIATARGDEVALAKQVERILWVKHLGGFHSHCGWRTPMMRDLLAFALRKQILPEVAQQWIRERKIPPPAPLPPSWPVRVRIQALDGLTVTIDGEPATPAGSKSPRKLRELVAVLAAEPTGATAADLAEWLWPEVEGDKAAVSLKAALHRARRWLGTDAIRLENDRFALSPEHVDCDVWHPVARPLDAERVLQGFDAPPIHALRRRMRERH